MHNARIWVVLLCVAGAVSSCSTAVKGTSQTIQVGSTPEGAECVFVRDGQTIGKLTTPGPVTVTRDKKPINVVCTKSGHEEATAVLNSLTTSTGLYGPGIIGAVFAASALVDMASGADTRYQTALMVKLERLSAADQTAAGQATAISAPKTASAAMPAPAVLAAPAAASQAARFDGAYQGDVELIQRKAGSFIPHVRHVEVTVSGGVGTGTIKHPLCYQPGAIAIAIDAAGQVTGTANTVNTDGCIAHKSRLVGRVEGNDIRLTITRERFEGSSTDFSLVRKPAP